MTSPERPRQVTLGGWLVLVGSVVTVLAAFERIGSLHTWETREQVEEALREAPLAAGLDPDALLDLLRVLATVAGCCAAASAVLGWQVLRSRRPTTRTALTVLVVPLLLTGVVTAGLAPVFVGVGVLLLWLPAAREWFGGTPAAPPSLPVRQTVPAGPGPAGPGPDDQEPHDQVRSGAAVGPVHPGDAAPSPEGAWGGAVAGQPPRWEMSTPPRPPAPGTPRPQRRPAAIGWACWLTWVSSGLVSAGMLLSAAVLAAAPGMVLSELQRQRPDLADELDRASLTTGVYGVAVVVVVWSALAAVLAALTFRGVGWARVALIVSAGLTAACCLPTAASVLPVVPLGAAVATLVLLLRSEARAWCR